MVSAALSIVLAVAIIWHWREDRARVQWIQSALVLLLLVRFAAPLGALANGVLYQHFMAHDYNTASAVMAQSETALGSTSEEVEKGGFFDRAKGWIPSLTNLKALYDTVLKSGRDWSDRMVELMTLFILQTLLIPLGFLWLSWRIARAAVAGLLPSAMPREATRSHNA